MTDSVPTQLYRVFDPATRVLTPLRNKYSGQVGDSYSTRLHFEYPAGWLDGKKPFIIFDVKDDLGNTIMYDPDSDDSFDGVTFDIPWEVTHRAVNNRLSYQLAFIKNTTTTETDGTVRLDQTAATISQVDTLRLSDSVSQSLVDSVAQLTTIDSTFTSESPTLWGWVEYFKNYGFIKPVTYDNEQTLNFKTYNGTYDMAVELNMPYLDENGFIVKAFIDPIYQLYSNLVTAWQETPDDLHYVSEKLVKDSLDAKQNTLTFDSAPTADSTNPVTSGGVKVALDAKATAEALAAHTGNISNPHRVTKAQVGLGNCDNTSDADKPVSTAQAAAIAAHADRTDNPHSVTKAQVGLENADNTSDLNKPISTAVQNALGLKANAADLGTAAAKNAGTAEGDVPVLGVNGKLADGVLPPIAINEYAGPVNTKADLVTLVTTLSGRATGLGDWANVTSETGDNVGNNGSWILTGNDPTVLASWVQMYAVGGEGGTVYSVNGRVGIIVLTKSDVGLDNCDNTSDADKPISNAVQSALNTKQAALTFDSAPTASSVNPVTSGGVHTAIADESSARSTADTTLQTNINAKQNTVTFVTVTVASASWSSGVQTVTVTGMTAAANFIFSAGTGQGQTALEALLGAEMDVTAQAANSVTLTCYGAVPTADISLTFAIFG